MVTIARRLIGFAFVGLAVLVYLDGAERGTFTCERATATCVHVVEHLHRAPVQRSFPVSDVIGAASKWSYWEEAPGAREHLASVRSRDELDLAKVYRSRQEISGRRSTSSPVIFTRHGLVPLLSGFTPGQVDAQALNAFMDGQGERAALVQDERLSALPLPVVLLALGALLVLLRGPSPRMDGPP